MVCDLTTKITLPSGVEDCSTNAFQAGMVTLFGEEGDEFVNWLIYGFMGCVNLVEA